MTLTAILLKKGINYMKVKNFVNAYGNNIPNQFIIEYSLNFTAFQSYKTLIAVYSHNNDVMYIDKEKYSCTTSKYLNRFKDEYSPLHIQYVNNHDLHDILKG